MDEFLAADPNSNRILTLTPRDVDPETGSVNIVMNVDSLQEMTRDRVETYRFIERVLAKGAFG